MKSSGNTSRAVVRWNDCASSPARESAHPIRASDSLNAAQATAVAPAKDRTPIRAGRFRH